jgi:tRNA(Arg) A34 adenosine deaminase TadA
MTPPNEDPTLLRRAIEIASYAVASGDAPYGSLLARHGEVLAEAQNTVDREHDITAHPELKLARSVKANLSGEVAAATTLFTSCEPCGMCTGAIARSGLRRVVYALSNDQLNELVPGTAWPGVPTTGPDLYAEATVPVQRYYATS